MSFGSSPYPEQPKSGFPSSDERMWAMFAHLSPLVLGFIGPLIIWVMKKDESPFVSDQAKESLNFTLAVMIAALVTSITCVGPIIIGIGALIMQIMAGMEANKGVWYRYQYTIRMIQ